MARARGQARQSNVATPARTTKIPLNDDSAEKAKRLRERSLLQSIQKQKMKAAASPGNRRQTIGTDGSPKTPRNVGTTRSGEGIGIDAVTPLRKVPILANFEEWMKMATDNVGALRALLFAFRS
jgi:condensin complex subunit 2